MPFTPEKRKAWDIANKDKHREWARKTKDKMRQEGRLGGPQSRIVVSYDGESKDGKYFLFQNDRGLTIDAYQLGKDSLSIWDVLPKICIRQIDGKKPINVLFGSFFDWNELFKNEPEIIRRAIFAPNRRTRYLTDSFGYVDIGNGYQVRYIPRKRTTIKYGGHYYNFDDCAGFFGGSFLDALTEWHKLNLVGPVDPIIPEGKDLRGDNFAGWSFDKIRSYNLAEVNALTELMNAFRETLKIAGYYRLNKFYGAGCLADLLMKECKADTARLGDFSWEGDFEHGSITEIVEKYKRAFQKIGKNYDFSTEIIEKTLRHHNQGYGRTREWLDYKRRMAYFGGRIELCQRGSFERVYSYDISSCYPTAITKLPALDTAKWKTFDNFSERDLENYQHGIAEVEWKGSEDLDLGPFPFRSDGSDNGSVKNEIIFPTYRNENDGYLCGIYHLNEIREAIRRNVWDIRFTGRAWVIETVQDYPFKRFSELLDKRMEWKNADPPNPANIPLKLAMNSGYGKTAQKVGKSPYHELFWAGEITAFGRSMLLRYAKPNATILMLTDGVYSLEKLDCPISDKWGDWESKEGPGDFLQAGLYRFKGKTRSRGYPRKHFDFDGVYDRIRKSKNGSTIYDDRMYIGIRKALVQHKTPGFYPYPKRINWNENSKRYLWHGQESIPIPTTQKRSAPYALDSPEEMKLEELEKEMRDSNV